MPKPRSPKEIKQFLGLTGYYRKFILRFADMARPLTKLLAHDCEFKWTNQCDNSFQMLKDTLCSAPKLKYPDTNKSYTLYTDASKYRWAGVLTQSHTSMVDRKSITMDHPVSYVSGLFRGSQLNWAALTKEAYACISAVPLGNKLNNWEIHFDWFYFFTGYSRVHCKYQIHQLFARFSKKNPNNREIHYKEQ